MCWACEEQEMMFRYDVERKLAQGEMPDGMTAAELEAMGYALPARLRAAGPSGPAASEHALTCDSPDRE